MFSLWTLGMPAAHWLSCRIALTTCGWIDRVLDLLKIGIELANLFFGLGRHGLQPRSRSGRSILAREQVASMYGFGSQGVYEVLIGGPVSGGAFAL